MRREYFRTELRNPEGGHVIGNDANGRPPETIPSEVMAIKDWEHNYPYL